MGKKHRTKKDYMDEAQKRDHDTEEIVREILRKHEIDVSQLRKVAAVRGLATHQLRAKVWPIILGIDLQAFDWSCYDELSEISHRDSSTLRADIPRSMNQFSNAMEPGEKEEKRKALTRLINAVVNLHAGEVYYYQGMHDIAAVLLLTVGEHLAFPILSKLVTCQLRDCTRKTLQAVTELLQLILPIVEMAQPDLAALLKAMGIPSYFALSWFITWFSHDVDCLDKAARLFDLFLAAHPMMPLYVGAAGISLSKDELIDVDDMCEMHSKLVNLRMGKHIHIDDLVRQALSLYARSPPRRIVRRYRIPLGEATAPDAYLEGNYWAVPDKPIPRNYMSSTDALRWTLRTITGGIMASGSAGVGVVPVAALFGVGALAVAVAVRYLDGQMDQLQDAAWDSMFNSRF